MAGRGKPTICRICKENCGILVSGNRSGLEIRGNPEHPISRGFICFRGRNYAEVHYSPQRLTQPLLKRGWGWEKISWENAMEVLGSRIVECKDRYGAQSVVFYKGESLKHQEIDQYMRHLSFGFGSPNYITVSSLCHNAMALGFGLTIGGIPLPDFERMKMAIIWGANPAVSAPRAWSAIKKARQAGTKIIVIDPSCTQTAINVDLHLPIQPGSDGILALAFIKYGIERAAVEPSFPETGWQELKRLVCALSYDEILNKTGIDEKVFRAASSLIYSNLPGWIQAGVGLELQPCGVQTFRAIASLQSILDPQNRPSRARAELAPLPGSNRYPDMPPPVGEKQAPVFTKDGNEGQGMYLTRAIFDNDPYPVRAMLVAGGNPLLTFPGSGLYRKAFEALDFLAVFDLFMTPTAAHADLILPAADFLENLELHDYGQTGWPCLGLVRPVVSENKGWPTWKLIFELARSLGLKDLFPWKDNEEALRVRLAACGLACEDLMASPSATIGYRPARCSSNGWSTPDGKVHYHSTFLGSAGYTPLPVVESLQLPQMPDETFPFWLSTGDRLPCFQHSQFRESPAHRAVVAEPTLEIHPDAAAMLRIRSGEMVLLATRYGKIYVRANLEAAMRSDCLRLSHGWEQANANELTDSAWFDPISGFPWMRALPARVEKMEKKGVSTHGDTSFIKECR